MKLKLISLVLTAALALTACASKQPLVSDTDSTQPVQTEQTTVAETTSQPSAASSGSSLPDTAKWAGLGQPYPGGSINLLDAQGKMLMPTSQIAASQPVFTLSYRFDLDGFDDDEVQVYIIAAIGGEVCDLELAGEKSTGGMLCVPKVLGREYKETLKITDCGLKKGSGEIAVCMIGFCDKVGRAAVIQINKEFCSDSDRKQQNRILAPDRCEQYVICENADKNELFKSSNFEFEKGSYDEEKNLTTVAKGTKLFYRYINANDERNAALDSDILLIVLKNGKPMKLFGGRDKAVLPLTHNDYSVLLPIDELNESGYAKYQMCLFRLGGEAPYTDFGRMFYVPGQEDI